MIAHALTLSIYDIKRLARRRLILLVLLGVPAGVSLARALFAHSSATLAFAWACPFVCVGLVWLALRAQRSLDAACGLLAGLRSTPMTDSAHLTSRVVTGGLLFAAQMAVFAGILGVRF